MATNNFDNREGHYKPIQDINALTAINRADDLDFDPQDKDFFVSMWIKPESINGASVRYIYTKLNIVSDQVLLRQNTDNTIRITIGDTDGDTLSIDTIGTVSAGTEHFVAFFWDRSTQTVHL